ncbi:MAG: hypothetical protein HKN89_03955 [Eudoraea sp.]|nr:hypothetical protein [Eudoraea sp.]
MDNTIYVVLAVLFIVYLWISIYNRRSSKKRRRRKFMEDYRRKDRSQDDTN